jgi:hypothetical protein
MSELIFVTTDNCELCKKAEKKIKFLKPFYQIREVDVEEDHKEFLLRVPVLIKNNRVIEEGIFSRFKSVNKFIFLNIYWFRFIPVVVLIF